ncbi:acyltransferase family protein [Diplocloster agilis]|uniref:acyltransferase family protein n=1 Tax=Diplocloster agilis TaxID=2850323 RepID=UPI0008216227|nr:acyltransferase family protein [Suonthocola fibrivorans]MCU6733087.1 acyltransferase family protein [Suonthocola fibrivorans]SCI75002.1 Fucose 4-O-acetylase and related acetyltransferases [uncultured Clostridium sp.]
MQTETNNNIQFISIAKGIGILLVVLGHCTAWIYLKRSIYLFHMPLFFFISGYLFKDYSVNDLSGYVIRKLKTLYLPFVGCNLFALLFHQLFCSIGLYPNIDTFTSAKEVIIYIIKILLCVKMEDIVAPLWFLPILMFTSVSFCVIRLFELRIHPPGCIRHIFITGLYLLSFAFPNSSGIKRAFVLVSISLFTYNIGFVIRNYNIIHASKQQRFLFAVVSLLSILIGPFFVNINMIQMRFSNPVFYAFFSCAGIYLVFYISKWLVRVRSNFFSYCGDHSMVILQWHYYVFLIITILQLVLSKISITEITGFVMHISTSPIENIVWTCIYWSFGLFIPLVIQYCILQSSSSAKKRLAKGGKRREKN